MLRNQWLCRLALIGILLLYPQPAFSQIAYKVVDIGSDIPHSTSSWGIGINSLGDVVTTYDRPHNWGFWAGWMKTVKLRLFGWGFSIINRPLAGASTS